MFPSLKVIARRALDGAPSSDLLTTIRETLERERDVTEPLHRVRTVEEGLALEAEVFAATGTEVCLWMSDRRGLVCPANLRRRPGFDIARSNAAARGWPVLLRRTGGGAVPQGPGVVNLALGFTAGPRFSIEDGYRLLTGIIRAAVAAELTPGATPHSFCDGAWNLSIAGRKVVGTAQRIRPAGGGRKRILAHALILTRGDVGAGAAAVDAFHADLTLPPVSADAHITLAEALGRDAPGAEELARGLEAAARAGLAGADGISAPAPARGDSADLG